MIIGISGWQKTFKTGFGRAMMDEIIALGHTEQAFGNLDIFGLTIPYTYRKSIDLLADIKKCVSEKVTNTLYFIDGADMVIPHRFWKDKEQTITLTGIWEDEKLWNDFIYTYHRGLGVDKILRLATGIEIKITAIGREEEVVIYTKEDWRFGEKTVGLILRNIGQYYDKYNYRQPVI